MNTPTLIGILVLGYLLLKNFGSSDLGSNLTGGGSTGAGSSPNPTSPTSPSTTTTTAPVSFPNVTPDQLMQSVGGIQYASSDGWCYAFRAVTGIACPGSSVVGASMTAAQFLNALYQYAATGITQNVPTTYPTPTTTPNTQNTTGGPGRFTRQPITTPRRGEPPSSLIGLEDGPVVDLHRMRGNERWKM